MKNQDGNDTARAFANDFTQILEEKKDRFVEESIDEAKDNYNFDDPPAIIPIDIQYHGESFDNNSISSPEVKPHLCRKASNMEQFSTYDERKRTREFHVEISYDRNSDLDNLDQIWSTALLICNVYNTFTFFFFLGIRWHPEGLWAILEVLTEIILLLDCIVITFLKIKYPLVLSKLPRLCFDDTQTLAFSNFKLGLRILSSYPQHTINLTFRLSPNLLESLPIALLRIIKIIRFCEV